MRRPWWTVMCPVCGEELPERGNRRVYVPWKRGFRLVHADDCAGLIEAQGVLDVTPPKRKPIDPVVLVRARRSVQALLDLPKPRDYPVEDLRAIRARLFTEEGEELVGDERLDGVNHEPKFLRELVDRLLHAPQYSGQTGRLLGECSS